MYTPTAFAQTALAQTGKPYVLGAEASISDPNPARFDCSELVEWLLGRNGTPIGDLAAAQYDKTIKAAGTVRVGDLVFLRNNPARWNRIGHVAIIIGGAGGTKHLGAGQYAVIGEPIIVEARGRSAGVVRTTLTYWRSRAGFTGVRRFPGFALAEPAPAPSGGLPPARLTEDGQLGPKSIDALQWTLDVPRTGVLDKATRAELCHWLGFDGSTLTVDAIARLQARVLDVDADGQLGPVTATRWQQWINTLIAAAAAKPGSADFRVGIANVQGYNAPAAPAKIAAAIKTKVAASSVLLTETTRPIRRALEAKHGATWWCFPHESGRNVAPAILLDLAKWTPGQPRAWRYYLAPDTKLGHGAMCLSTRRRANGFGVDQAAVHVRPKAIASDKAKAADTAEARALRGSWPIIIGGDWSQNNPAMPGFTLATSKVDTYDQPGDQTIDLGYVAGDGLTIRGDLEIDPGQLADHIWRVLLATATKEA